MSDFSPDWNFEYDENGNPVIPGYDGTTGNISPPAPPVTGNDGAGGAGSFGLLCDIFNKKRGWL